MLWKIAMGLTLLWLAGLLSNHTIGGLTHLLLVMAIIVFLIQIIRRRRAA